MPHIRIDVCLKIQTDDSVRVAVLSLKAAGQGITLTAATTVVFAELDVVPGALLQVLSLLALLVQKYKY